MTTTEALLALNQLPKIGPVRIRRLLERFGSAEAALAAGKDALLRVDGIGEETAGILARWQDHADPVGEMKELQARGLSLLLPDDPAFPPTLRQAYDAPILLYVWGKVLPADRYAIGVVGTRRASIYGSKTTQKLSYQLAHAGFTILSGLARGIDTAAHEAALAVPEGRTIAVIGSGLAKLFPAENMGLAEKIADGRGAVVTEFPLHTPPDRQTFPQRNRIVAAWSKALLVTECPARSGSLITANLAVEYGKPVFAVPGPIDKATSGGCNQLIRQGATLVTDGSEILEDLSDLPFQTRPAQEESTAPAHQLELPPEEAAVLAAIGDGESGIDQLIELTGLPAPVVSATLMKLEFRSLVRALPGFRYTRR